MASATPVVLSSGSDDEDPTYRTYLTLRSDLSDLPRGFRTDARLVFAQVLHRRVNNQRGSDRTGLPALPALPALGRRKEPGPGQREEHGPVHGQRKDKEPEAPPAPNARKRIPRRVP